MRDQMIQSFKERYASLKGERGDLHLADAVPLPRAPGVAALVIGFALALGRPRRADVFDFLRKQVGAKIAFAPASLRFHDAEGAITVSAALRANPVPVAKSASLNLIPIVAGVEYRDAEGKSWDVIPGKDGPLLVRREAEDVNDILKERILREGTLSVRASNLRTAGRMNLHPGDVVRFYANEEFMKGEVSSVQEDGGASIKAEGGGSFTVSLEQIADVVSLGPASISAYEKEDSEYFSKYYPSESGLASDMSTPPPKKGQIHNPPGSTLQVPSEWPVAAGAVVPVVAAAPAPSTPESNLAAIMRLGTTVSRETMNAAEVHRVHGMLLKAQVEGDWKAVSRFANVLDTFIERSAQQGRRVRITGGGAVVAL